jgi:hypothetical protein
MYVQEPQDSFEARASSLPLVAVAGPAVLTLLFGVFPGLVFGFLNQAATFR